MTAATDLFLRFRECVIDSANILKRLKRIWIANRRINLWKYTSKVDNRTCYASYTECRREQRPSLFQPCEILSVEQIIIYYFNVYELLLLLYIFRLCSNAAERRWKRILWYGQVILFGQCKDRRQKFWFFSYLVGFCTFFVGLIRCNTGRMSHVSYFRFFFVLKLNLCYKTDSFQHIFFLFFY